MGENHGSSSSKSKCINPSLGIVKRWQGIVELILRAVTIVLALIVLAGGASSQSSVNAFANDDPLPRNTDTTGGWLIFISFWVILYQAIAILQRFLNFRIINSNITAFLIIDIILVAIGALGYLAGAAAIATYANRWRELSNTGTDSNQFESTFRRVISATVAAAFFGFLLMFWMIGLAVYIGLGAFFFNWGPTKAKYTAPS